MQQKCFLHSSCLIKPNIKKMYIQSLSSNLKRCIFKVQASIFLSRIHSSLPPSFLCSFPFFSCKCGALKNIMTLVFSETTSFVLRPQKFFIHHYFYIISTNVNTVPRANHVFKLLSLAFLVILNEKVGANYWPIIN